MSHARVAGLWVRYTNVTRAGRRTAGVLRKCHTRGSQDCGCVSQMPHARVAGLRVRYTNATTRAVPATLRVACGSRPGYAGLRPDCARVTPPGYA
eukprot:463349-Prorocentrum_minimum.AAC.1